MEDGPVPRKSKGHHFTQNKISSKSIKLNKTKIISNHEEFQIDSISEFSQITLSPENIPPMTMISIMHKALSKLL